MQFCWSVQTCVRDLKINFFFYCFFFYHACRSKKGLPTDLLRTGSALLRTQLRSALLRTHIQTNLPVLPVAAVTLPALAMEAEVVADTGEDKETKVEETTRAKETKPDTERLNCQKPPFLRLMACVRMILYSESQASMPAQWVKFENAVYNATGRVDHMVARAIKTWEIHQLRAFLPKPLDPAEYTLGCDKQGNTIFDATKKTLYEKAADMMILKGVDAYVTYLKN